MGKERDKKLAQKSFRPLLNVFMNAVVNHLHFFDLNTAEPFNESNTEILNVQNVTSNDGFRGGEPWVNLVFHRDAIEQTSENEYRVNAQISSRYWDRFDHFLYIS